MGSAGVALRIFVHVIEITLWIGEGGRLHWGVEMSVYSLHV